MLGEMGPIRSCQDNIDETPFTEAEDSLLTSLVNESIKEQLLSPNGLHLYQKITDKFTNRSVQSLRSRYLKVLQHEIESATASPENSERFFTYKPNTQDSNPENGHDEKSPKAKLSSSIQRKNIILTSSQITTQSPAKQVKATESESSAVKSSLFATKLSKKVRKDCQEALELLMELTGAEREVVIYSFYVNSGDIEASYRLLTRSIPPTWSPSSDMAILTKDPNKILEILSSKSKKDVLHRFEFLSRLCDAPTTHK